MADNWVRILNTTIPKYIREEEVNILRQRKLTAMLQERGRISFNHSGQYLDWKVRYKRNPLTGYADGDTLSFARSEKRKTAQLDWRGYSATDSITKMEEMQNKGNEAIIKLATDVAKTLMEDVQDNFAEELYVDGNAAGNTKRIHGFESFMSTSAASTYGYVGLPNDTYAGLSCTLGNYGGSWSTSGGNVTWPVGRGSAEYDFWSPLVVDYGHAAWLASGVTWADNCIEAVRFGITHFGKNKAKRGQLDVILLDKELYRGFLQQQETKQQIQVNRGQNSGLVALGFRDVINFDGIDVTSEYGLPTNVGYGLSYDAIELCSLQSQLFASDNDMVLDTKSKRFSVDFLGNMKCNPRHFIKFVDL